MIQPAFKPLNNLFSIVAIFNIQGAQSQLIKDNTDAPKIQRAVLE